MLEEGVATHRDIDFGLMAGAGLDPRRGLMPPFMRADVEGLDTVLERLGERPGAPRRALRPADDPAPPGRPGPPRAEVRRRASTPTLSPTPMTRPAPTQVVSWRRRPGTGVAIAWLANGQMNAIAPAVIEDLGKVWAHVKAADPPIRALVIASSNPFLYSAGADIKAFTRWTRRAGASWSTTRTRCSASWAARGSPRSPPSTASPSAAAASWRWRATCGSSRARRVFGQPEIKLGIIPGFGGTQRLPRLVGAEQGAGDEPVGDPLLAEEAYEYGLASAVVDDHELLDTALVVGAQARRLRRRWRWSRSSVSRRRATSTKGSRRRRPASRPSSPPPTRARGSPRSWANARRGSAAAPSEQSARG